MGRKEGGLGGIPSVCGFAVFFCLRGACPCSCCFGLSLHAFFFAAAKKVSKESGLATASL
jgi:uncharacterized membrane protein